MARNALLAVIVLSFVAGGARADWFDWTFGHKTHVTDPDDVSLPASDGKEMLGVWWGRDASYDYFRMDLAAAPTFGDSAEIYGLYIFAAPSGGAAATNPYVPDDVAFDGTDHIVDSHTLLGSILVSHQHDWDGGSGPGGGPLSGWYTTLTDVAGSNAQLLTSGTGLEWRIPLGYLPSDFAFRGATFSPGSSTTFDTSGPGIVPEPSTWAMLGLGLAALVWRRRRALAQARC